MKYLILLIALISCGNSGGKYIDARPPPDFAKAQPIRDCYTFVSWMYNRLGKCGANADRQKWLEEKMLGAVDCEKVFQVADRDLLYGKCKDDVFVLKCEKTFSISVPESCYEMFYFWEE